MQTYRRVTFRDRCQIQSFLQGGHGVREISRSLGFHRSTIYRELSRNGRSSSKGFRYGAQAADQRAECRKQENRRPYLIQGSLDAQIFSWLRRDFSPEQIAHRLHREGGVSISVPTIYSHIHRHGRSYRCHLRRFNKRGAGRYRQRQARISGRTMIDQRPSPADRRARIGDWERDGMYAANGKQLLVLVDRKSRYLRLEKMRSTRPSYVTRLTHRILEASHHNVFTITNDNGPEFRDSHSLHYPAYHCYPRKPQQRGTVENTIGLLRQYIARTTNLDQLSSRSLRHIEHRLNLRPRKCLDYKTPHEVFFNTSVALAP